MKKEQDTGKKKLLIITNTYYPKRDGQVIFLEEVVPDLTDEYEITILAPRFLKGERPIAGAKLVTLKTSRWIKVAGYYSVNPSLRNLRRTKKLVKKQMRYWKNL